MATRKLDPPAAMLCCASSLTGRFASSVGTIYQLKASSGVQSPAAAALVATNSAARVSTAILAAEERTPHQA
jgi:hypothetical protein